MCDKLLSVPEAAATLGISRTTLHRLVKNKKIEYVQIGDRKLFSPSGIAAFVASVTRPAVTRRRVATV
jgi:excisionase family DNA binding protein